MSAEETLVVDDQAASIWHVDRTARVTQLISGDPTDPRALVLVRDNGRNSDFVEIEGMTHPEYSARVAAVEAASPRTTRGASCPWGSHRVIRTNAEACSVPPAARRCRW